MMKRAIISAGSYCRFMRLWTTRHSAGMVPSIVNNNKPNIQLSQLGHRCMCTSTEDHKGDDMELPEFIPPPNTEPYFAAKFRTDNYDPSSHTMEDEGLYYKLDGETYEKYLKTSQWPGYRKQVNTFREAVMMVRKPALEAAHIIDNCNLDHPPITMLLFGRAGAGKSMTMSHLLHRYAHQNWVTVYVPSMRELIRHKNTSTREFGPSTFKPERFDYLDDAVMWLKMFQHQNAHLLEGHKSTKQYVWSGRESSPEGTELIDLLELGQMKPIVASDIIGVVLRELKIAASEKKLKVLVAVDGINAFWKDLTIKDENKRIIHAQEVSMFHHFKKMFESTWTNGACIGTVCNTIEILDTKKDKLRMPSIYHIPSTPQHLLRTDGFEFLDPFIPIEVPEYSSKECYNCLEYYIDRKWIVKSRGKTDEGKKELIMLSSKNPLELMKITGQW